MFTFVLENCNESINDRSHGLICDLKLGENVSCYCREKCTIVNDEGKYLRLDPV